MKFSTENFGSGLASSVPSFWATITLGDGMDLSCGVTVKAPVALKMLWT